MSVWQQWWQLAQTPGGIGLLLSGVLAAGLIVGVVGWRRVVYWRREHAAASQTARENDTLQQQRQWRIEELQREQQNLEQQLAQRGSQLDDARQAHLTSERKLAELNARLETERSHYQQQLTQLQSAEQRLADTFKRLAGEIFEDKTRRFNQQSQERLGELLNPIQTQLKDFGKMVQETHQKDMSRHAVLEKELHNLRQMNDRLGDEARQLVDALRGDVKVMGTWGELKLERLLTLAGLEQGREFDLQHSVKDSSGKTLRPDAVIWLPEGKSLIVDAKVSLEHYRQFRAAEGQNERDQALKLHVQSLRQHVRGLGHKEYQNLVALQSPNFVFMFVPSEPAYLDALQADEELLTHAQNNNVVMLSPANLLATLRTVASLWHAWRQNENALDIARRAGLLYDKFVGFTDSLQEVGMRLEQAQNAYDVAFNQLSRGRGNLVRQTEQLRQLGARASKQLDPQLLNDDETTEPRVAQDDAAAPVVADEPTRRGPPNTPDPSAATPSADQTTAGDGSPVSKDD